MPSQDFKYVQASSHKKGPHKNNAKAGGKAGKGGRIRVQAGDKRVPPSKSKPKNRQTVGPHEESTLNMDSVQWSDQHHSVKALTQAYSTSFPLMVRVTHGYYGELGTDVSIGQVIQIHSFGLQKRVSAKDSQDQLLSIPLDYPVEVTLLEKHDRVWMRLRDAVLSRPFPLKVRVMNMSHDAELTTLNIVGEDLTITAIREEVFLKGNSINDGWIDQVEMVLIPSFVHAAFSVAVYMRGATEEEWSDFQGMYNRSVRHLHFGRMNGYCGIYVDGENPYPLLDRIKPDPTRKKSPEPPVPQLYENLPHRDATLKTPPRSPVYDNMGYMSDENNCAVTHQDILPHFANAKDSHYPVNNITLSTEVHSPPRTITPFSEVDENEVEEMFDNVIKVGKETMERQQNEEREEQERLGQVRADEERLDRERLDRERLERERLDRERLDRERLERERLDRERLDRKKLEKQQREAGSKPEVKRSKTSDNHDLYANHIDSSLVRKTRLSSSDTHQGANVNRTVNELLNRFDSNPDLHSPRSPAKRSSSHKEAPRGSYISETSSGTPMGVIQPTVFQRFGVDNNPKMTTTDLGKPSTITSMEDVPADVTALTVEDVCQCLTLMNMDFHISKFRTHQIDGKLLHDIKENVLLKEFQFTPFNASKLMRFVRGWRPKIS